MGIGTERTEGETAMPPSSLCSRLPLELRGVGAVEGIEGVEYGQEPCDRSDGNDGNDRSDGSDGNYGNDGGDGSDGIEEMVDVFLYGGDNEGGGIYEGAVDMIESQTDTNNHFF